MNENNIRVLFIDDDPSLCRLMKAYLGADVRQRFELACVGSLADGMKWLGEHEVDVVLLDLGLPDSSEEKTFLELRMAFPALPVVVFTGLDDADLGAQLVQSGAQDFLVKGQINGPLVCRTLRYAMERKRLLNELQMALTEVQTLSGLLPMCANCKRIRDDKGYWNEVENYIQKRSGFRFTHGLCPECAPKFFPFTDADAKPKE
ncbi:MAG: response regulator [Verrucomicrobiota bacterium]